MDGVVTSFEIGGHTVGGGAPCFVIAEAGVNHNGDVDLAHRMIDVAADAGADAVKFQTFRAERLVTDKAPKAAYQVANDTTSGIRQFDMLKALELGKEDHAGLIEHCWERDIIFLSTPFDTSSVDFLVELGMAAIKVPSGELTNTLLLAHVAGKGLPLILSTGMADLDEVKDALDTARTAGATEIALLHCVSAYPAPLEDVNLRAMDTLGELAVGPVGFSDHTLGSTAALAAVARGASVIEKHFTVDRAMTGPDHKASMEPDELAALVRDIRDVETLLGSAEKATAPSERDVKQAARRFLVCDRDMRAGDVIRAEDLTSLRTGGGIPPGDLDKIVGRRLAQDVSGGTPLLWDFVE